MRHRRVSSVAIGQIYFQITIQKMQYNRGDDNNLKSEEPLSCDENQQKCEKKSRRTKHDENGRTFACSCGKSYFSYPALYTHVKTKHNGKVGFFNSKLNPQINSSGSKSAVDGHQSQKGLIRLVMLLNQRFDIPEQKWIYSRKLPQQVSQFVNLLSKQDAHDSEENRINWRVEQMANLFLNLSELDELNEQALSYLHNLLFNLTQFAEKSVGSGEQAEGKMKENEIENKKKFVCNELPLLFNSFILGKKVPHFEDQGETMKSSQILCCKVLMELGAWMVSQKFTDYIVEFNLPK